MGAEGVVSQPTQAVILVGGLGTRLGQLTVRTPKPLLSVSGRPFLDYLVEEAARHGCRKLLFLAQFEAEQVKAYVASSNVVAHFDLAADVTVEPFRAGTGGALWHARDRLDPLFFLLNGDSWLQSNLLNLAVAAGQGPWRAVLSLRRVDDGTRFGAVEVEGDRVRAFHHRGDGGPALINGGVYLMRREIVEDLTPACSLESDLLPVLAARRQVIGVENHGYFIDIGVPDTFERAQQEVADHFRRPALFLDRDGVINIDHGHVGTIDRFEWTEGAIEAIKYANDLGHYVFVVSNQAGVARGLYSEQDVRTLHGYIQRALIARGAHIDDFRYCLFHTDSEVASYARSSDWRKPEPGMLLDLARFWRIDMPRSLLIGDRLTDVAAATAAGVRGVLYRHAGLQGGTRLDEFLRSELAQLPRSALAGA